MRGKKSAATKLHEIEFQKKFKRYLQHEIEEHEEHLKRLYKAAEESYPDEFRPYFIAIERVTAALEESEGFKKLTA